MPFPSTEAIMSFPKTLSINMENSRGLGNFALYSLVKLGDSGAFLHAVRRDSTAEGLSETIQYPPRHDFSGLTLKDIVEYHEQLFASSEKDAWDYGLFIVAVHEDYIEHGVVIANLINTYYSDDEAVPALVRCPLECDLERFEDTIPALSWCTNLQIGNMDLEEMRDQEDSITWLAPIPGYTDLQAALEIAGEELKSKAGAKYESFPTRTERYAVHHVGDHDRDTGTMEYDVEPDAYYKEELDKENKIATTGGVTMGERPTEEGRWQLVRSRHPVQCSEARPRDDPFWRVNKFWLFVFDRSVADGGRRVALVRVQWDGVTEGKSKEELEAIMPELQIVERCAVEEALARMDTISGFEPEGSS